MEMILQFSIIAIPIIIGVTKGINAKLKELFKIDNKLVKELVTLLVSWLAVAGYSIYVEKLEMQFAIALFIVLYFGASGIYQFVKTKTQDEVVEEEFIDLEVNDEQLDKELGV